MGTNRFASADRRRRRGCVRSLPRSTKFLAMPQKPASFKEYVQRQKADASAIGQFVRDAKADNASPTDESWRHLRLHLIRRDGVNNQSSWPVLFGKHTDGSIKTLLNYQDNMPISLKPHQRFWPNEPTARPWRPLAAIRFASFDGAPQIDLSGAKV